jgi:hypothetical protein
MKHCFDDDMNCEHCGISYTQFRAELIECPNSNVEYCKEWHPQIHGNIKRIIERGKESLVCRVCWENETGRR